MTIYQRMIKFDITTAILEMKVVLVMRIFGEINQDGVKKNLVECREESFLLFYKAQILCVFFLGLYHI